MSFHKQSTGINNHAVTAVTYADITARDADTEWQVASNIDKVLRVESPLSYYSLLSVSPAVYLLLAGVDTEEIEDAVAGMITNGAGLTWTYNDGLDTLTGDVSLASFNTSDLSETGNLYYTEARVTANTSVVANTVHKSSDGTDHAYLDQDVTITSSPTFAERITLTSINRNTAIGEETLTVNTGMDNVAVGNDTLKANTVGGGNTAIGSGALRSNTDGTANIGIGLGLPANTTGDFNVSFNGCNANTTGNRNMGIGVNTLAGNTSGNNNTAIGLGALTILLSGSNNVAIGDEAGHNTQGSGGVFIGAQAGYFESGSNKLYIANNNTATPLLYGDFAAATLKINGDFDVTGNSTAITQVGGNNTTKVATTAFVTAAMVGPNFTDATLTDPILQNPTIQGLTSVTNSGDSIFIGEEAGIVDDLVANHNVGIGRAALKANTSGVDNTGVGYHALISNISGTDNVALGAYTLVAATTGNGNVALCTNALSSVTVSDNNIGIGYESGWNITTAASNVCIGAGSLQAVTTGAGENTAVGHEAGYTTTGSGNVFLGYTAGFYATGSDKLFIDNSTTADPLIYGEFNNNLLRINGFTQLGDSSAPKIKHKKLTGTTGASDAASVSVTHGLTMAKILAIEVLVAITTARIPPNTTDSNGYEYEVLATATTVDLNLIAGNNANIRSKGFTVLVTYEE